MKFLRKTRFSKGWLTGMVLGVTSAAAALVYAASLTIPNSFVNGTNISSTDMSANFNAVATAVNANDSAITANTSAIATNTSNITTLQNDVDNLQGGVPGTTCAGNDATDVMVRVGPLCVDKYEASAWDTPAGGGTQYGAASDDYPCSDNGNDCSQGATNPIYARSQAGVTPSANITWFQAQQACANAGKRLLTNAEWQMAAAGTPDPGAGGDGINECNTNTVGTLPTGNAGVNCLSNWGASDMVGNVWEWVADWVQGATPPGNTSTANSSPLYGGDSNFNIGAAPVQGGGNGTPAALLRGGDWFPPGPGAGVFAIAANFSPAGFGDSFGFRCAR